MKLKDIIAQAKYQVIPDKENMRQQILDNVRPAETVKKHNPIVFRVMAVAAVLFLVFGVGYYSLKYFTFDKSYNISGDITALSEVVYVSPRKCDIDGAATNTTVDIVTKTSMSANELKEHISVQPAVDYTVKKKGVNRFSLSFESELENDTSYTVNSLADDSVVYRWSIQTVAKFAVTNVYPTADDEYVDNESGIEVTFSESSVNEFQEYFSITPSVSGTFAHRGRTWTFIPDQPLQAYTKYTVTVSGDITGLNDKVLGDDYVFSFVTGYSEDKFAYVSNFNFDIADTFLTSETPLVKLCANGMNSTTADITVYRLPDSDAYIALHKKYGETAVVSCTIANDITEKQYPSYSKFSSSAIHDSEDKTEYYFAYPKSLEAGYYIAEIQWDGVTMYQFLQSTDYAIYTATTNGDYSVWVNSAQSKSPVKNATVQIDNSVKAQTDENGLASLSDLPESNEDRRFITVSSEGALPYVICVPNTQKDSALTAKTDYYSYLYTNSVVYRTTDTIRIWGTVLKRNASAKAPTVSVYADFTDTEYPVEVNQNGVFTLEIPIQNYKLESYAALYLRINGQDCQMQEIFIEDYDLPSYTLSAQTDKNAYFIGETIHTTIKATYYDNTPAANLTLENNRQDPATTNESGIAEHSETAAINDDTFAALYSSCDPYYYYREWNTVTPLEKIYYTPVQTLTFYNSEYLGGKLEKAEDGKYSLSITTNKITLDKINALSSSDLKTMSYPIDKEYYLDSAVNKSVSVELHEVTYERKKIGSSYNPLTKKVENKYEFTEVDTVAKTFTVQTTDGKGILENLPIRQVEGYSYIKLTMKDNQNRDCFQRVYVDDELYYGFNHRYLFQANTDSAVTGDEISLQVRDSNSKQAMTDGSYVYNIICENILKTSYVEHGIASFTFEKEYEPDVYIYGAYFDGTHIYSVCETYIQQDTSNKALNITVTPDKEVYAPGDKVNLTLNITDASGKPVSADFNVNVMDMALFSVAENNGTVLETLYEGKAYLSTVSTSVSYRDYDKVFGEGGGGGGGSYRNDFEDTPAFISGKTSANGTTDISFELSDSITTWTIIAQGVNSDGLAGEAKTFVVATKDIFITSDVSTVIKASDDAVIPFRTDGSQLTAADTVTSTVTLLQNDKVVQTQTLTHAPAILQSVNFGKLVKGNYTVRIESVCGNYNDAVEYTFSVKDSALSVVTVSDNLTSDSASVLLLMDKNQEAYAELLKKLQNASCTRIDYQIGEKIAKVLSENASRDVLNTIDWSFLYMYQPQGYTAYTQNSDGDLFTTVRMVSLLPEQTDRDYIEWYFDQIFTDKDATVNDILCALWGKAALGIATEKDLAYYYAEGNGFTLEQQLYFALAYAYGGNQGMANQIYSERIRPQLTQGENGLYIADKDETVQSKCNAMLAMLTCRIASTDAPKVLQYAETDLSETALNRLSMVAYALEYVPLLEGENSAEITYADGSKETVTYRKISVKSIAVPAEKCGNITVNSLEGETVAKVIKAVTIAELLKDKAPLGDISCSLPENVLNGETFDIFVSCTPNADGSIELKLPTGIHYVGSYDSGDENGNVAVHADHSRLTLYSGSNHSFDIALHCQAVLSGNFQIEPMILTSDSGYYASAPLNITIGDNQSAELPDADYPPQEDISNPED